MNAPICCGEPMKPDAFIRYQNGKRSGEQTAQRVTFGYKCSGCSDTVRLPEAIVVDVSVGW